MTEILVRPSRRSFMRAAAWSVPVVSIAAAAPAFALTTSSSSLGSTPLSAIRYSLSSRRHVAWDLTLTNGPVAIQSIAIAFTYVPVTGNFNFEAFTIYGYQLPSGPRDNTWSSTGVPGQAKVNASHGGIAVNSTTRIHTDFRGGDNSSGGGTISAVATITYVGGAKATSTANATWVDGTAHSHPNA